MSKKIKGYSFLSLALLILAVFIEDFFFISLGTPSFVEKIFGIYEPWGSLHGGFRE
ncbi:hypothetical protein [Domibacillus aminovorans]|uniref:hypothetical protein n=1 Tax=Domibacillus aminovorans TaxID=29332 RepID=UPI000AF86182|nr:hypothetical protein [Domibacillus aminovorans]